MIGVHRHLSGWRFLALVAVAGLAAAIAAVSVSLKGVASATEPDISFQPVQDFTGTEPLFIEGGTAVGGFIDLDNVGVQITAPVEASGTIPLCGNTNAYTASIDWGDGTALDSARVTCANSGTSQYAISSINNHTYADSGTYHISVTVDDRPAGNESPHDADTAQTAKAIVDDASISAGTPANVTGTEGKDVTVKADFFDSGSTRTSLDLHLSATVAWGDGTSSAGTIRAATNADDCECNVVVTGTTSDYDARATKYNVSITLTDDGGSSSTARLTATIGDAALTAGAAKSFTSTASQASNHVVASFTDAAGGQAAAADFTATITWGDNTTSPGTVTRTAAGAFDVSGTHTFATSGTKTLTITVADEEGKTVTMSATATVPALPATGRPSSSGSGGWPLLPAALILLGLVGVSAGLIRARLTAR